MASRSFGHGDVTISLLLVFPLLITYQVGILFVPTTNGADLLTPLALAAASHNPTHYVLGLAGLVLVYLGILVHLRRRGRLSFGVVPPMLAESAIYALTLGTFILFIMQTVFGFDVVVAIGMTNTMLAANLGSAGDALVMSLGAGVHEELVFRLGVMAAAQAVLHRTGAHHRWTVVGALIVSSVVFAAAHHIGAHGEPFALDAFIYRALAGTLFGLIFYYRSFAHAVYTHFFYDFYVLVIRGAL